MKIGALVRTAIPSIAAHCNKIDQYEFNRLCDRNYSKETLDVNFPFWKPVSMISKNEHIRYWNQHYVVSGILVRVTSQWFNPPTSKSQPHLIRYLKRKGIQLSQAVQTDSASEIANAQTGDKSTRSARGRFKGNAIGNAQNLLVRNILSNIGAESFGSDHWQQVINAFGRCCAYCGQGGDLVMDHVVPINKQSLGEHRLGNIVPSCRICNADKADKGVKKFLSARPERVTAIENHMLHYNYVPISENEQIRQVLELAHKEVAHVADRYIEIINTLIAGRRNQVGG